MFLDAALDRIAADQELVQPDPAFVAGAVAAIATLGAMEDELAGDAVLRDPAVVKALGLDSGVGLPRGNLMQILGVFPIHTMPKWSVHFLAQQFRHPLRCTQRRLKLADQHRYNPSLEIAQELRGPDGIAQISFRIRRLQHEVHVLHEQRPVERLGKE